MTVMIHCFILFCHIGNYFSPFPSFLLLICRFSLFFIQYGADVALWALWSAGFQFYRTSREMWKTQLPGLKSAFPSLKKLIKTPIFLDTMPPSKAGRNSFSTRRSSEQRTIGAVVTEHLASLVSCFC